MFRGRSMDEPMRPKADQPKLSPERYVQAKTFLDNGVITKEQFLEMTHGQAEPEAESNTHLLIGLQKSINDLDLRLKSMEGMMAQLAEFITNGK